MKCLLWEHCPVSIQKTTAFVGLVTQKEAFWWTAYRRKHWTQCAALAAHKKQQLNREAIPLRKTKICICGLVSGGFANKKGCRSNAPRADDSWECDCGSMREQAWLIHTHTHTQSCTYCSGWRRKRGALDAVSAGAHYRLSEKWGIFSALSLPVHKSWCFNATGVYWSFKKEVGTAEVHRGLSSHMLRHIFPNRNTNTLAFWCSFFL